VRERGEKKGKKGNFFSDVYLWFSVSSHESRKTDDNSPYQPSNTKKQQAFIDMLAGLLNIQPSSTKYYIPDIWYVTKPLQLSKTTNEHNKCLISTSRHRIQISSNELIHKRRTSND